MADTKTHPSHDVILLDDEGNEIMETITTKDGREISVKKEVGAVWLAKGDSEAKATDASFFLKLADGTKCKVMSRAKLTAWRESRGGSASAPKASAPAPAGDDKPAAPKSRFSGPTAKK